MMARFVEKEGFVDGLEACALARRSGVDLKVRIVGDAGTEDLDKKLRPALLNLLDGPTCAVVCLLKGSCHPNDWPPS